MCESLRSIRELMCVAARRIPLRTVRELEEPGGMERATQEQPVDLVSYCLGCKELASKNIAAHVVTGALLLTVPSASRALHKSGLEKTAVNYFNMAMLMGVARHIRDQHQIPVSPLPCVCWWMAFQPKYALYVDVFDRRHVREISLPYLDGDDVELYTNVPARAFEELKRDFLASRPRPGLAFCGYIGCKFLLAADATSAET